MWSLSWIKGLSIVPCRISEDPMVVAAAGDVAELRSRVRRCPLTHLELEDTLRHQARVGKLRAVKNLAGTRLESRMVRNGCENRPFSHLKGKPDNTTQAGAVGILFVSGD